MYSIVAHCFRGARYIPKCGGWNDGGRGGGSEVRVRVAGFAEMLPINGIF